MRYATMLLAVVILFVAAPAWADFKSAAEAFVQERYAATLMLAEQGNANAQYDLAGIYKRGEGVPQDYAEAVRWYRLAAEQGHANAQFSMGVRYITGEGVPQDCVLAHMWVNLAAAQGNEKALKLRELMAKKMTPAELADAQRMAREWTPK